MCEFLYKLELADWVDIAQMLIAGFSAYLLFSTFKMQGENDKRQLELAELEKRAKRAEYFPDFEKMVLRRYSRDFTHDLQFKFIPTKSAFVVEDVFIYTKPKTDQLSYTSNHSKDLYITKNSPLVLDIKVKSIPTMKTFVNISIVDLVGNKYLAKHQLNGDDLTPISMELINV